MNTKTFLDNFGHIADAPNGVAKLRDLILQLAVQGKLVEQNLNEGSATDLVEEIRKEKTKILKARKSREPQPLPEITESHIPFLLPSNWCWVRLGDIQIFVNGFAFKSGEYDDQGVGIVRIGDIQNGVIEKGTMKYVPEKYIEVLDDSLQIKRGDLVIAMSGATTGKLGFNITDEVFLLNQRVGKIEIILVDPIYAFYYLSTKVKENLSISAGSAIPNLSTAQINNIVYPLPPIEEQKRIVAKVDQLMALCDELESQQIQKAQTRVALNNAALDKLLTAQNPDEFNHHWQRIANNFHRLYDNLENLYKLGETVKQLAIQGKLMSQFENESAQDSLEMCEAEKESLVKNKIIKNPKHLEPVTDNVAPFALPANWVWVRLGTIAKYVEYGTSHRTTLDRSGVPVLAMGHIQSGMVTCTEMKYVQKNIRDLPRLLLKHNDILFNRTNSYELVGKAGIYKEKDDEYTFASYLIRVSLLSDIDPDYINLALNAPYYRATQIEPEVTQQCGQANFNGTKLQNSLIPLPPFEEQKRIVAKVDQLMALCDQLETKLKQTHTTSEKLVETTVMSLVAA